jgi:thiamine kinase-like enzyme
VAPVVPDLFNPELLINGQWCKNPICDLANFRKKAQSCVPESFTVIHGDCTFSNTLIDHHNQVWFIDPRGRFGSSEMFGDPQYDWAKLYYSVVGNYDSINQKQFCVNFNGSTVDLVIRSNGYEQYSDYIRERSGMTNETMTFLQCNLWLSLTGYVREDIDAVLYAFYNGVYLWNQL